MKFYDDYMKEWEQIRQSAKPGQMVVRSDVYVTIHFLEDHGAQEPWKLTPWQYEAMFDGMDTESREKIESCIESTMQMFMNMNDE